MIRKPLALACAIAAAPAIAETPQVATDIAPIHSLVAMVMGDLGTPDLIVTPGASPHTYALRPSQARALQNADLVVWVGPELTPWLSKPLASLSDSASELALLKVDGLELLEFRDHFERAEGGADHGHDDHDHEEHEHDGHDHADHDHDDHDHDDHDHDDHDHAEHDHEEHDHDEHAEHDHAEGGHHHEGTDPHAWLDPEIARAWLAAIATELAELDPDNAETYATNAASADKALEELESRMTGQLESLGSIEFVTLHDAFQYFEHRFDIHSTGAVSLGDAADPGPARLKQFREKVTAGGLSCAFAEPQFDTRLLDAMLDGQGIEIKTLDPLGSALQPGPALYPQLLEEMAETIVSCAKS
ncbi:MAG: zinc ABC transporter substrate-binding protein [Heliomarina sp.]|uniref:zinc ABC transporter substrate-binding protein n=1 Tax=Heliomarina sp. TaxID=2917556 RepID=UPI004058FC89